MVYHMGVIFTENLPLKHLKLNAETLNGALHRPKRLSAIPGCFGKAGDDRIPRVITIHYLKPVSLFGFQKVCTSFVAPVLVIPAQANL